MATHWPGSRLARQLGMAGAQIEACAIDHRGSTSVRAFEEPMREAAAVARSMLVGAAADRWNVDPARLRDCRRLRHQPRPDVHLRRACRGSRRPHRRRPSRRSQITKGRLIGQPLPRLDGPAKADGSWRFAGDVRLPGMLFASAFGSRRPEDGLRASIATRSKRSHGSPPHRRPRLLDRCRRGQLVRGGTRAQGCQPQFSPAPALREKCVSPVREALAAKARSDFQSRKL